MSELYDLLIIGGGINGCSIARDAAGRGLKVYLCEQGDIASATSSWSSKLIHGGIRYLENYEFKLVREALQERDILMRSAPYLIHPLQFILPHEKHLRPAWMIRLGLFLYDHLNHGSPIPTSQQIKLDTHGPLKTHFKTGFSYYDCQTDDSRLTLLNALDAKQHGATIQTYTKCTSLSHDHTHWHATLTHHGCHKTNISSKMVINATGPWVTTFNHTIANIHTDSTLKLVQGSHIVVPKLYPGQHAYILQNSDNRIVFTLPFQQNYTLIGTTDTHFSGDPSTCQITKDEIHYLCKIIKHYFKKPMTLNDIVWSFSGVRALHDNHTENATSTTRDYHLEYSNDGHPAYLSIFGGKITTCRRLAENALKFVEKTLSKGALPWTKTAKLPGGQLDGLEYEAFIQTIDTRYDWLDQQTRRRYIHAYGDRIHLLLKDCKSIKDLGKHYGASLYEKEISFWKTNEIAKTADDMLWRRSKLGLQLTPSEIETFKTSIINAL